MHFPDSRLLMIALMPLVALFTGCGQGEYDSRMDGAATAIANRGKAAQAGMLMPALFTVSDAASVSQGLKLRLPTPFGQPGVTSLSDIPRAKFTGADIPGFLYTMEQQLDDDAGKKLPVYCYLYSVSKSATPPDQFHAALQTAVAAIDGTAAWASSSPAGSIPVMQMQAKGTMDYEVAGPATENLPSKLQLYSLDAGANQIIIGFRAADSVATKHKFFEAAAQSISTAQLDTGAPAPAPMPMPKQ